MYFENTSILLKSCDEILKINWENIVFDYDGDDLEFTTFLEDYVCISNFKRLSGDNLRKQILTTQFTPSDLSLAVLSNEEYAIIPKNSLNHIRLTWNSIPCLLRNETNKLNFKLLSPKTKIIITLDSMYDFEVLNKFSEFVPDHSELELNNEYTNLLK